MKTRTGELKHSFLRGAFFALGLLTTSALAITVSGTINTFTAGDLISAGQINANFSALRSSLEAAKIAPVGSIVAWHKSFFPGAPPVPDGWVECNGQIVADSASPFDGLTVPNLNGDGSGANSPGLAGAYRMFLRGDTTSGSGELDNFQGHGHDVPSGRAINWGGGSKTTFGDSGIFDGNPNDYATTPVDIGYGAPRYSGETRPVNMSVVWIMRIK